MPQRFISIWFRQLKADWYTRRHPQFASVPFVLVSQQHGRLVITETNNLAKAQGIFNGMAVADARAIFASLECFDDEAGRSEKLLCAIAEWFIRFTPVVSVDLPDGLMLDVSGCAQLWGGEQPYLTDMHKRLKAFGYHSRIAIADTIGTAWAVARYGQGSCIAQTGEQRSVLQGLPAIALRIDIALALQLNKLGLRQIGQFMHMPRPSLRRRFGAGLLLRLDQALGCEPEAINPVIPVEPYREWLPSLEPISTATGIEIALQQLLESLCSRLKKEEKGLRSAFLKCCRIDGKTEMISISTNRPSSNARHLFKLFEHQIENIEPALGIELFLLEARKVEDCSVQQEKLWNGTPGLDDTALAELLDRIAGKLGEKNIRRFIPAAHYWPERSFRAATSLQEKPEIPWRKGRPRPLQLLAKPEAIEVTAPIPDYPPMLFRHNRKLHKIVKADGPERIEPEWWLQEGEHRDYYYVEDEEGKRYWLFRLGHYDTGKSYQWFLHGYFA